MLCCVPRLRNRRGSSRGRKTTYRMSYEKLSTGSLPTNPKETASFFSLLTFSWMNYLVRLGNLRPLENDDLPALLEEDQSQALTKSLEKEWSRNCKLANTTITRTKTANLWFALFNLVPASEKAFVLILVTTHIMLRLMQPLFLVGLLAELMKEPSVDHTWIYLYAACICLSAWIIAICQCHCDYRTNMIGMRMRSALLGVIYKKVRGPWKCYVLSVISGVTQSSHIIRTKSNPIVELSLTEFVNRIL